jgi:hypothetical protein
MHGRRHHRLWLRRAPRCTDSVITGAAAVGDNRTEVLASCWPAAHGGGGVEEHEQQRLPLVHGRHGNVLIQFITAGVCGSTKMEG